MSPNPYGVTPITGSGPQVTSEAGLPGFTTEPSLVRWTSTHQSWQKALGLPMFCHSEKNSVRTRVPASAGGAQLPVALTPTYAWPLSDVHFSTDTVTPGS